MTEKHEGVGAQRCSFVEVFVDYSLVGKATEFPIHLARSEAAGLQPGNRFIATGDSVPTFVAEVCELLEDGWAVIRLVMEVTAQTDLTKDSELVRTN
jgi:hypothetical protein